MLASRFSQLPAKAIASALILFAFSAFPPFAAMADETACEKALSNPAASAAAKSIRAQVSTDKAWQSSQASLARIKSQIKGQDHAINVVMANALAEQFTWLNGDPGGAKTMISRKIFESLLETITEGEKRTFLIQFHKLVSEGKITGFPKIKSLLEKGRYEIETSQSLVGDRYLFLIADEAEKSNPATLNAMLSVLNERAAFHGARVVKAALIAGVFTSNKSISEFLDSFGEDRAAGEALLDRMGMKVHVLNQQTTVAERAELYGAVYGKPDVAETPLYFTELKGLLNQIEIPDELVQDIAKIIWDYDVYVTAKMKESDIAFRQGARASEYFPPNQFSNRSVTRIANLLKSAFLVSQLAQGVEFKDVRKVLERSDLSLLSWTSTYNMGSALELKSLDVSAFKASGTAASPGIPLVANGSVFYQPAEWNPYLNQLTVFKQNRSGIWRVLQFERNSRGELKAPAAGDVQILESAAEEVIAFLKAQEEQEKVDLKIQQFRSSRVIDAALARGTIPTRTRNELKDIADDQQAFASILNTQLAQRPGKATEKKAGSSSTASATKTAPVTKSAREMTLEEAYNLAVESAREANQDFQEVDYAVEALITSILAGEHVYMFGPPGGAKTALSQNVLKRVLKAMKRDGARAVLEALLPKLKKNRSFVSQVLAELRSSDRKAYEIFVLQFHKLLPEGVITGFPKLQTMLDTGKEEIDFSTSLAADKFIFAILDETDKANPQTLTALLSILNERLVFAGSETFKAALQTAVMTSNKMTSEMLDSFFDDRSAGEAFLDRVTNKVLVMNKMSTLDSTIDLIRNFMPGLKRASGTTEMPLHRLKELVNKVEMDETTVEIVTEIHEKFLSKRLNVQEESRRQSELARKEFPDYYIMASSPSDRTYLKLMRQIRARLIAQQIVRGVAFKDLNFNFDLSRLPLFFEGLGYWTPGEITAEYDANGILQFKMNREMLEGWLRSARMSRRVTYFLEQTLSEAQDYTDVVNGEVYEFIIKKRDFLAEYPHLFPELFKDTASRKAEVEKK